jgi:Domain of unknown function (DUF6894)
MPLYRFSIEVGATCVADSCAYLADATLARECATHVVQRLEQQSCRPTGGWSVSVTDDDGDEVLTLPVSGSAAIH